jgi:hypothetical protein
VGNDCSDLAPIPPKRSFPLSRYKQYIAEDEGKDSSLTLHLSMIIMVGALGLNHHLNRQKQRILVRFQPAPFAGQK